MTVLVLVINFQGLLFYEDFFSLIVSCPSLFNKYLSLLLFSRLSIPRIFYCLMVYFFSVFPFFLHFLWVPLLFSFMLDALKMFYIASCLFMFQVSQWYSNKKFLIGWLYSFVEYMGTQPFDWGLPNTILYRYFPLDWGIFPEKRNPISSLRG